MPVLYTHTDFDGLACAVLVTSAEAVGEIRFAEPREIQGKEIDIAKGSIVCDLPYHPAAGMWFDHHASTAVPKAFEGKFDPKAKSAARAVMEYYENPFFEKKFAGLVDAADKIDSASFTPEELKNPTGYYLISISLETREGSKDGFAYRRLLISLLREKTLEQVLKNPEVIRRAAARMREIADGEKELEKLAKAVGNVVVIDFRGTGKDAPSAGRFSAYLKYPECTASIRVKAALPGFVEISIGENIFSRSNKVDIGGLCKTFGGGGHKAAGGFTVPAGDADSALAKVVETLNAQ